ncbi:MAG: dephospho-CoA kinase [Bacillota bacterium]|jgi:dephospho-CoA kinase
MVVIGLVGNIGSGKSLAAHFLEEKGAGIINADQIAREIVQPQQPAWQAIIAEFGQAYLLPDGNINRKKLGEKVFNDQKSLLKLNSLTHPLIYREAQKQITELKKQGFKIIVLEAAILLDSDLKNLVDEIWLIMAPSKTLLKRITKRDFLSRQEAESRLESQTPAEDQVKFVDRVILNEQTVDDLRQKMYNLYDKYIVKKKG